MCLTFLSLFWFLCPCKSQLLTYTTYKGDDTAFYTHIIAWITFNIMLFKFCTFSTLSQHLPHTATFYSFISHFASNTLWCCNLKSKSHIYIYSLLALSSWTKGMKISWKKVSSNLSLYQNTRSIRIKGRCSLTHHHREIQFVFFTFILFRFLIKKTSIH